MIAYFATAQEVVSETSEYVTYQDSFFVLKSTTITNFGLDGLNDTVTTYSAPLDSAGLINTIKVQHLNRINEGAARWRNNYNFRTSLVEYAATKTTLESLGVGLDSIVRLDYQNSFVGRWRFFNDDGTSFFVNLDTHPTRADLMRGQREDDLTFVTVTIFTRWLIRVAWGPGDVVYLFWDGTDSTRPVFRHGSQNLPAAMVAQDRRLVIKVQ